MATIDDIQVGAYRSSMDTNTLLHKPELGKPKKLLFNNPAPEVVFGMPGRAGLEESARDVIMTWKDGSTAAGQSSPGKGATAPPASDFRTMNKMAVAAGLTKSKDMRTFREANPVHQQPPWEKVQTQRTPAVLPSDKDPQFTYGCPSTYKPLEEYRRTGEECKMQDLIQGRYVYEWVEKHLEEGEHAARGQPLQKPRSTLATQGHARGAQKKLVEQKPSTSLWKMSKFQKVDPKTETYRGRSPSPGRTAGAAPPHDVEILTTE